MVGLLNFQGLSVENCEANSLGGLGKSPFNLKSRVPVWWERPVIVSNSTNQPSLDKTSSSLVK